MNVGRKKPIMPSPRCMDKLRSDLTEHQVDAKIVEKMEELKKSIHNDRPPDATHPGQG